MHVQGRVAVQHVMCEQFCGCIGTSAFFTKTHPSYVKEQALKVPLVETTA